MEKFWGAMSLEFSTRWKWDYGDIGEPVYMHWLKELREFSIEELRTGFLEAKRIGQETGKPPQLIEFRRMCRPNTPAYHEPVPRAKLDYKPVKDPSVAQAEIAKMRKLLK